jgi:hypothetical protein
VNRSRQTGSHPPPRHRIRKGWEKKIAYDAVGITGVAIALLHFHGQAGQFGI